MRTGYDSLPLVSTQRNGEMRAFPGLRAHALIQRGPQDIHPAGLAINAPSKLADYTPQRVAWLGPQLRTTFSPTQPRSRLGATFSQSTTALSQGFREHRGLTRLASPPFLNPPSRRGEPWVPSTSPTPHGAARSRDFRLLKRVWDYIAMFVFTSKPNRIPIGTKIPSGLCSLYSTSIRPKSSANSSAGLVPWLPPVLKELTSTSVRVHFRYSN